MALIKRLMKVGDSRAVVLPKPFLDQMELSEHGEVELTLERDRIVIAPHRYATREEVRAATKRTMKKHRQSLERLAR